MVIVTNEDPYDEDPQKIIDEVAAGVVTPTFRSENLYKILDRREAIKKALRLAQINYVMEAQEEHDRAVKDALSKRGYKPLIIKGYND